MFKPNDYYVVGDIGYIALSRRNKFPLFAKVDKRLIYEILCYGRLHVHMNRKTPYAQFGRNGKSEKYLHRHIMDISDVKIPDGKYIDHLNQNSLDNRLSNLRLVTNAENMQNTAVRMNNRLGIQNVCIHGKGEYYHLHLRKNGKIIVSEYFPLTPEGLLGSIEARNIAREKFGFPPAVDRRFVLNARYDIV